MILCIQTALPQIALALLDKETNTAIWDTSWISQRDEATVLLPEIKKGIVVSQKSQNDITQVLAVNGPGSFTALRVGLSIANTIAYVQQIPLIGISTFSYLGAATQDPVFSIISASLRDCFVRTPEGEEVLLSVEETITRIGQHPWIGRISEAQSAAFQAVLPYRIQEAVTEGERFETLMKSSKETTSIVVPYYMKGANITQRKCR